MYLLLGSVMLTYLFALFTSQVSIACSYTKDEFNIFNTVISGLTCKRDPLASFECLSKQRNI